MKLNGSQATASQTNNSSAGQEHVRRRYRVKTTPQKQITQENNITVAYHTPLPGHTATQTTKLHQRALVTRGDLVATSKYYQHHKSLGHTPKHVQQITGTHKRDSCKNVGYQLVCAPRYFSSTISRFNPKNKNT